MPDRDHVIATMEYCLEHGAMGGRDCWVHCDEKGNITNSNARDKCPNGDCKTGCVVTPIREAIELLKEQQSQIGLPDGYKPIVSNGETKHYQCGICLQAIDIRDNYCRHCGRAVKWE